MGLSLCGGVTMSWGQACPCPSINEMQNIPATNAVLRGGGGGWGGGPVLFAPVGSSSYVVLAGDDFEQIRAASLDAAASPGLAALWDAYRSSWEHGNHETSDDGGGDPSDPTDKDELAWADVSLSPSMFDVLGVYLAFSQQGLTTHTITMDLRADGFPVVWPADADALPCDASTIPRLERRSDGVKVAVAVDWQPGQLDKFNTDMVSRFIAGGRPCPSGT